MLELYESSFKVGSRDADMFGRCRPSALLGYLQDITTEHSQVLGSSRNVMLSQYGCVWMLARIWFRLYTPLKEGQRFAIKTWHRGAGAGAMLYRDYDIYVSGRHVGEAVSGWTVVDMTTRRIVKPGGFENLASMSYPSVTKTITLPKLRMPEDMEWADNRRINYSDTDVNGHMNNSRYADIACDVLNLHTRPDEYLKELFISYSRECKAGEELCLLRGEKDEDTYVRGLASDEKTVKFDMKMLFGLAPNLIKADIDSLSAR